jgi:UDP:flavonoid glycosyltransferase YjiC (YdhE family)
LGHATRAVPIISYLLDSGAEVVLASDGIAADFLKRRYANLELFEIPSYDAHYPEMGMQWAMLKQISRIKKAIHNEHQWLEQQAGRNYK